MGSEVCDTCGESFGRRFALKRHQENIHQNVENTLTCEFWGKSFAKQEQLKQHTKRIHEQIPKKQITILIVTNVTRNLETSTTEISIWNVMMVFQWCKSPVISFTSLSEKRKPWFSNFLVLKNRGNPSISSSMS